MPVKPLVRAGLTSYTETPRVLEAMDEGPFYIANIVSAIDVPVGAGNTDHDARVLDTEYHPIDGLCAIGLDGCMLYRNVCTIQVSGTACMNSIFTGRAAANHAYAYLGKSVTLSEPSPRRHPCRAPSLHGSSTQSSARSVRGKEPPAIRVAMIMGRYSARVVHEGSET